MRKITIVIISIATLAIACHKAKDTITTTAANKFEKVAAEVPCPACDEKAWGTSTGVECSDPGSDCKSASTNNMSQNELNELRIFDSYFINAKNPCDYFNQYNTYPVLFSCLSNDFITQIQNHGVNWCKYNNSDGTVAYAAIPQNEQCSPNANILFVLYVKP